MKPLPTSSPLGLFADALIQIRSEHGLTQLQCAELIERFPFKMLQKYEQRASQPPPWVQILLIDALNNKLK